jgi:hypothetical protein
MKTSFLDYLAFAFAFDLEEAKRQNPQRRLGAKRLPADLFCCSLVVSRITVFQL